MWGKTLAILRRIGAGFRREGEAAGFRWEPTLVAAWTIAAVSISHYHRKDWSKPLLRWIGGKPFARYCWYVGLDLGFLLQVCVPILAIGVLAVVVHRRTLPKRKGLGSGVSVERGGPKRVKRFSALLRGLEMYGLGLGNVRFGVVAVLLCYLLYLPCFIVFYRSAGFQEYYGNITKTVMTWHRWVLWEIPAVFFVMLRTEFLFRGFLLFGFKRAYGTSAAILASVIPYVMAHYAKPEIETFGSFPVGLALAYLAARTGSIWYGVWLHWTIALMLSGLLLIMH